jgi:hypothetical protein
MCHVEDAADLVASYGWSYGAVNRGGFQMAEEKQMKSPAWRCRHLYPVLIVTGSGGERRARCLGCGMTSPPVTDLAEAMRALRGSFARTGGV